MSKVFKFGGASVKDGAGMLNVAHILKQFDQQKIVIVVSATGKTTNALEKVVQAYMNQDESALPQLELIKYHHYQIMQDCGITSQQALDDVMDTFVEIDWILEDEPHDSYDYVYDQIVSVGELVSSKILYYTLLSQGHQVAWVDIRGALFTEEVHRDAKVDWELTLPKMQQEIKGRLKSTDLVVTQGFIGSTTDNHTTTLGREGSDYTAAIISYCIDAEGMHIWKDVPGVLTADPSVFTNVTKLERLSYKEAIEMTYYGAKVIHPKTIKPLQNKSIPLYVRPFNDVKSLGTTIADIQELAYPPIIVLEPNQALVHISVNDFSFVAEQHISHIFDVLSQLRLKVNMLKNTAISFTICVPNDAEKLQKLREILSKEFGVVIDEHLELITIRHVDEATLVEMQKGKITLFEERLRDTIQLVVKDIPTITRKEQA